MLINLNSTDLDTKIYRIVPTDYLPDMFNSQKNYLVKPSKWGDPFEDLLGRVSSESAAFAQCWTLKTHSDAMWRIYSKDEHAVRIRSTIRKLLTSVLTKFPKRAFVGRVRYLPTKDLQEFVLTNLQNHRKKNLKRKAETYLIKRPAFKHEKEVRLVVFPKEVSPRKQCIRYSIESNTLIDQIMLDPRLQPTMAIKLKERIRKENEYNGKILHSLLYAPPAELIRALKAVV